MNRKNSIEQFIRDHRPAFDAEVPGAGAWHAVENALDCLQTADGLEAEILLNRVFFDTEVPSGQVWARIEQHLEAQPQESADSIESFIRKNREALDNETPDLSVWTNIVKNIPASGAKIVGMTWQRSIMRAAASIALLLAGVSLGIWYARSGETPSMAMSEVSDEYAELEHYYQRDIAGKQQKLATFTGSQPAEVHEDMEQLDFVMTELQQELANVPAGNREQVIRAMIENYKAKAAILERVLERLEPANTETKNSDSDNEIKHI